MKLLMLGMKDLDEVVKVYEKAKAKNRWVCAGYEVPIYCSKGAIERRIIQMRQDLLQLSKGL